MKIEDVEEYTLLREMTIVDEKKYTLLLGHSMTTRSRAFAGHTFIMQTGRVPVDSGVLDQPRKAVK